MQWPASRQQSMGLGSTAARTAAVTARTTQTVDRVNVFVQSRFGEQLNDQTDPAWARYWLDIYDAADIDGGLIRTAWAEPVADGPNTTPIYRSSDGAANTNLFTMVDEGPLTAQPTLLGSPTFNFPPPGIGAPGDFAYIPWPQSGAGKSDLAKIRFKCSSTFKDLTTSAPVSLVGKRIVDVKVCGWMAVGSGPGQPPVYPYGILQSTEQGGDVLLLPAETNYLPAWPTDHIAYPFRFSSFGASDRAHGWPWNPSQLDWYKTIGSGWFGINIDVLVGVFGAYLFEIHLEVDYVDEKRLAVGFTQVRTDPNDQGHWVELLTASPTTHAAATFNKTAGVQYLLALRQRPVALGPNAWLGLDATSTADHATDALTDVLGTSIPLAGGHHRGAGLPTVKAAVGDLNELTYDTTAMGFYFANGSTVRPDSQPYVGTRPVTLWIGGGIEQEFSNSASAEYGVVTVLIRNDAAVHATDSPLIVSVGRRSDNAILVTTSIDSDVLPPRTDDRWYVVNVRLPSAVALVAGQQYFVSLSSTATVGRWPVMALSTETNAAAAQSFGGTTNAATLSNIGEIPYWDAVVSAGQLPPSPILLGQTVGSWDTDRDLVGALGQPYACVVPTISYAILTWQPTTLGALFYRYEIERNDDGTWRPVAYVADPTTSVFSDFESRRNVPAEWRVRQVRNDGVWSDWSTFSPMTVPAGTNEVILAANAAPLKTLGLHEEPGIRYERASSSRLVTRALYGRDKVLAFRESEDRGDEFSRRLILAFNDGTLIASPTMSGRAVYDPLVSLVEDASLPHIAFIDHRGRRWYTAPSIVDMGHEEPGGRYVAEVDFVEVAGPIPTSISFGVAPEPPAAVGFYGGGYSEDY